MVRNDRPPYYKVRRGRAFFELGRNRAETSGMSASTPLGVDGNNAKAAAWRLYYEWLEKSGRSKPSGQKRKHPKGSLGSFFLAYRNTGAWAKKSSATRAEWEHVWTKFLEQNFGARRIDSVTAAEFEEFQDHIENAHGPHARWRMVKIARALYAAAGKHKIVSFNPAKVSTNPMPPGRDEIWLAVEVVKLFQTALEIDKHAMSLAIRIAWETALAPVDVRTCTPAMIRRDTAGPWIQRDRSKTHAGSMWAISDALADDIANYIDGLGIAIPPDIPFLRTSRDAHEYKKARFLADFDRVRKAAFGDDEKRRFQDIRRSVNLELALADATPEERAEMLANRLDKDAFLEATYTPPTVQRSRQLAEKRRIGRDVLRAQSVNVTGGSVK